MLGEYRNGLVKDREVQVEVGRVRREYRNVLVKDREVRVEVGQVHGEDRHELVNDREVQAEGGPGARRISQRTCEGSRGAR